MRHRNNKAILNRPADQRKALKRNLVTSLFLHGKLKTTEAKGKELMRVAEKLITRVRGNSDMNAIRELKKVVYTKAASLKALEYIKNTDKNSGFTSIVKLGVRPGDNALIVQVELL